MPVLLVIPARYASTRYPGQAAGGADGRHRRSPEPDPAKLGCGGVGRGRRPGGGRDRRRPHRRRRPRLRRRGGDDLRRWRNGTERCAEVARDLAGTTIIVVNLQGDAPLTPPWFVSALVEAMRADPDRMVATPVLRCDAEALAGFLEDRRQGRVGATTAVFDRAGRALYFSKEVIPYTGRPLGAGRARSRSSTMSASTPTAGRRSPPIRTGRSDRSRPGRGSSSSASWRTASTVHCVEVELPRAAPSGSSTTRPTCRGSRRSCGDRSG